MKHRELTTEVVSVSDQRDNVITSVESAITRTLDRAARGGLLGKPRPEKINSVFTKDFPIELKKSLENDIPVIKKVMFTDSGKNFTAGVNTKTQDLLIGWNLVHSITDGVEWCVNNNIIDSAQVVSRLNQIIDRFAEIIIHELVHLTQQERQPGYAPGAKSKDYRSYLAKNMDRFLSAINNFASREDSEIYHASPQEIPAYAHQMVYRLISQSLGGKKLADISADELPYAIQELRDALKDIAAGMSARDETLTRYLGFKDGDERRVKVYKRFMKAVYQEVQAYIGKMQAQMTGQLNERSLEEIGFAHTIADLSPEFQKDAIRKSSVGSNHDGREIRYWQNGSSTLVFFADNDKFDAVVYLENDVLKGMKNYTDNRGLIYALMHYIVDLCGITVRLTSSDQLTKDGLDWITGQIGRNGGLRIQDANGNKIDPEQLRKEWDNARLHGGHGPTAITIGESTQSQRIIDNYCSLMPYDIFGVTKKTRRLQESVSLVTSVKNNIINDSDLLSRLRRDVYSKSPVQIPLNETFDKPLPWRKRMTSWGIVYLFDTPEGKRVDMSISINGLGMTDIVFEVDGSMDVTGGGEAMAIFATVIDCVKDALSDPKFERVWKIEFSASKDDLSRQKLYGRFAKILPQAGYEFVGTHTSNLYLVFEFVNEEKKAMHDAEQKAKIIPPEEQIEESASAGATCSGSIATVSPALGGIVRRPGSSILSGINSSEAFPNTPSWMKTFKGRSQNRKRSH